MSRIGIQGRGRARRLRLAGRRRILAAVAAGGAFLVFSPLQAAASGLLGLTGDGGLVSSVIAAVPTLRDVHPFSGPLLPTPGPGDLPTPLPTVSVPPLPNSSPSPVVPPGPGITPLPTSAPLPRHSPPIPAPVGLVPLPHAVGPVAVVQVDAPLVPSDPLAPNSYTLLLSLGIHGGLAVSPNYVWPWLLGMEMLLVLGVVGTLCARNMRRSSR